MSVSFGVLSNLGTALLKRIIINELGMRKPNWIIGYRRLSQFVFLTVLSSSFESLEFL